MIKNNVNDYNNNIFTLVVRGCFLIVGLRYHLDL
jgi:hypothetical protein